MLLYVTDRETEAEEGRLDELPKVAELEHKAGHLSVLTPASQPQAQHCREWRGRQGSQSWPKAQSGHDHGPSGASGRASWPESPQRGLGGAEVRGTVLCASHLP